MGICGAGAGKLYLPLGAMTRLIRNGLIIVTPIWARPARWGVFRAAQAAFLAARRWPAMCGSGVWIPGMAIIRTRRMMADPGEAKAIKRRRCCAAVRGSAIHLIAAAPFASGTFRATGTSTSGFVWSLALRGHNFAFYLYFFSFFFFLFARAASENFF